MIYRSPKLLKHAKDQACVNCGGFIGTVAAHSNELCHGKGRGIKAHDCLTSHLDFQCHTWLDTGSGMDPTGVWQDSEKKEFQREMILRTIVRMFICGYVRVV